MFENPRRGRQARNFTTNAPQILDLKSSSEQIFSRKLPLGAPEISSKRLKTETGVIVGAICQYKFTRACSVINEKKLDS